VRLMELSACSFGTQDGSRRYKEHRIPRCKLTSRNLTFVSVPYFKTCSNAAPPIGRFLLRLGQYEESESLLQC